jgi:hypothetical protein
VVGPQAWSQPELRGSHPGWRDVEGGTLVADDPAGRADSASGIGRRCVSWLVTYLNVCFTCSGHSIAAKFSKMNGS